MAQAYTPKQILNKKFKLLPFDGQWKDFVGCPDRAFSAIVWGGSSSGKSSLAMQWARYLTQFGKVAYNSLEEGVSHTVQMNMQRNYMDGVEGKFLLLDNEPLPELIERMSKHKSPDFLIIDSIQYLRLDKEDYKKLKRLMKERSKALILISQATGKEPKGELADFARYDVDMKIRVEGYKAFAEGRLNGGGQPFVIYPKKAAEYWGDIDN